MFEYKFVKVEPHWGFTRSKPAEDYQEIIQDNSIGEKIDAVKRVQVLMLDDIGAEAMSSFVRDDVLGAILQFRMLENLPTFFTSNFDFKQLEHHFFPHRFLRRTAFFLRLSPLLILTVLFFR